jgi:hypothetical protein
MAVRFERTGILRNESAIISHIADRGIRPRGDAASPRRGVILFAFALLLVAQGAGAANAIQPSVADTFVLASGAPDSATVILAEGSEAQRVALETPSNRPTVGPADPVPIHDTVSRTTTQYPDAETTAPNVPTGVKIVVVAVAIAFIFGAILNGMLH